MRNTLSSRLVAVGIGLAALVGFAPSAQTAEYFLNNAGDDSGPGSKAKPWKNPGKLSGYPFYPGDIIRFESGQNFEGPLEISCKGTPELPILFTSTIEGKNANILSTSKPGMHLHAPKNIKVEYLSLSSKTDRGVSLDGGGPGLNGVKLSNLRISDCKDGGVAGFNSNDEELTITKCIFENVGENVEGGVITYRGKTINLKGNTFKGSGSKPTIFLRGVRNAELTDNIFPENNPTHIEYRPAIKDLVAGGNKYFLPKGTSELFVVDGDRMSLSRFKSVTGKHKTDERLTPGTNSDLPNKPQTSILPRIPTNAPTANPYRPVFPRIVPSATARPTNQVQYSTPQVGGLVDPRLRPSWNSYSPGMQAQIWSQYTNAVQQHIQKTANQMPAQSNLPSQKK